MKWFLIKMIFSRSSSNFQNILRRHDREGIVEFRDKALAEENYELAAYLEYYLKFKFDKRAETVA